MNWRLHLANKPLRRVYILPGKPDQIAVHENRYKVRFYDLNSGAHYADLDIDPDLLDNDIPEERRDGLAALKAPNGALLPFVEFSTSYLFNSLDGDLRLIQDKDAGLSLEIEDQIIPLEISGNPTVRLAHMERELGTIAALAQDNNLYIFQQQTIINTIPLENAEVQHLFMTNSGENILLVEANRLRLLESSGKVIRQLDLHFGLGPVALSPDGQWLAIGDAEYQLIRLYNQDLTPIRQQHAVDLLIEARQLQLFAAMPSMSAPLRALDVADNGAIAFTIAGMLCVCHVDDLSELPQPRLLF